MNRIADLNLLLQSLDKCIVGSSWKESVQQYEANGLLNCYLTQRSLLNGTYKPSLGRAFILCERGKTRQIKAPTITDRVVQKALNQGVLLPQIRRRLIYDNGASLEGKGNDFARRRFEAHVRKYFRQRGDNGGYILFADFSKFFDNLRHDVLRKLFRPYLSKEEFIVLNSMLDAFRPDVSYMSDAEYQAAMDTVFQSLGHVGKYGRTKLLAKGCDIGAEIAQTAGIFYPHAIDSFFKNVLGVHYYGRYMDDIYIIGDTKEQMHEYRQALKPQVDKLGIFLNERKTRIVRLDRPFVWLKVKYTLTSTGKLVRRLHHDAIVRERKRIKHLAKQLRDGIISHKYAENCYLCWRGSVKKLNCYKSLTALDALYRELIGPVNTYRRK